MSIEPVVMAELKKWLPPSLEITSKMRKYRQKSYQIVCLNVFRAWQIHCPAARDKSKFWLGKRFFYFTCPEKCIEYIGNIVIPSHFQDAVECRASAWNLDLSGPGIFSIIWKLSLHFKIISMPIHSEPQVKAPDHNAFAANTVINFLCLDGARTYFFCAKTWKYARMAQWRSLAWTLINHRPSSTIRLLTL